MKIDEQVLAKLEKLSSLKVDDEHKADVIKSLEEILGFVDNLNSLDVTSIDATFTPLSGGTQLREDIAVKSNINEAILNNAPKSSENFFIVPKII